MFYKILLCTGLVAAMSSPAMAISQHPISVPYLCSEEGTGSAESQGYFSRFVNVSGGLYWNGGSNPGADVREYDYTGVYTNVPNYPAQSVSLQYQLGTVSPGPERYREPAIVVIYFSDGSLTATAFGGYDTDPPARGFSITPAAHGFNTLSWNAATAGDLGKRITAVWFGDGGTLIYKGQSFQDYVSRITVDGIVSAPQVHGGTANACLPDLDLLSSFPEYLPPP